MILPDSDGIALIAATVQLSPVSPNWAGQVRVEVLIADCCQPLDGNASVQ
jgi:hypothetical protein